MLIQGALKGFYEILLPRLKLADLSKLTLVQKLKTNSELLHAVSKEHGVVFLGHTVGYNREHEQIFKCTTCRIKPKYITAVC